MKFRRILEALLLCAALGACALSPQLVTVAPTPKAEPQTIGAGRTLGLEVIDKRPQSRFGKRGGVYDTADIEPTGDVAGPIRRALAGVLTDYQFAVQPAGSPGVVNMRVEIIEISYVASGTPALTTVQTRADLAVSMWNRDGREYSGHSKVSQSKDVPFVPDAKQNEDLINDVVSRALERMLTHPDLLAFLKS